MKDNIEPKFFSVGLQNFFPKKDCNRKLLSLSDRRGKSMHYPESPNVIPDPSLTFSTFPYKVTRLLATTNLTLMTTGLKYGRETFRRKKSENLTEILI